MKRIIRNILILIFLVLAVIGMFQTCNKEDDGECAMCRGSGYYQKRTCPACNGSGYSDFVPPNIYD